MSTLETSDSVTALAAQVEALAAQVRSLSSRLEAAESHAPSNRLTLLVLSGDFDKLMVAFMVANGAAAMGTDVSMFFTFWGLCALRKDRQFKGKTVSEKVLSAMLPSGPDAAATSCFNMAGMGPAFFRSVMKQRNVESLPGLMESAQAMGVKMIACQTSMEIMGIRTEELIDGIEFGGLGVYLGDALDSRTAFLI
ncbi:MAG: DsrE/DsrF/DrsH-like family protein [Candidatus Eisenbacteria bacterium]|uniref:DsrE/DsrF/DrsH-like family protein n=1 Tax=Eiseniibacteriota bacterium TaxID=2212470 RepID=A0A956M2N2_UNCEI|nr:DsrE/DsrF/DrsH-like family protein [Candidatus Eisenbacteria bacterium]